MARITTKQLSTALAEMTAERDALIARLDAAKTAYRALRDERDALASKPARVSNFGANGRAAIRTVRSAQHAVAQ